MVGQQVPFLNAAFLLLSQPTKDFPKILPELPVQRLAAVLGDKHHVIFALPFRVT
jgi:hypothetical protein